MINSFGSSERKKYVQNKCLYISKAVFPNIKEIFNKEDYITKNKHKRNYSNISNGSTENDSSNSNNSNSKDYLKNKSCDENCNFGYFESAKKSRFFNIIINISRSLIR